MSELRKAAERIIIGAIQESDGDGPYEDMDNLVEDAADFADTILHSLLSDAPVTAEWLRETWGFDVLAGAISEARKIAVAITPMQLKGFEGNEVRVELWHDATYVMVHNSIDDECVHVAVNPTQGQFTMLCLGLGLTPKGGD